MNTVTIQALMSLVTSIPAIVTSIKSLIGDGTVKVVTSSGIPVDAATALDIVAGAVQIAAVAAIKDVG